MKRMSRISMRWRHYLEGYSFVLPWLMGFMFFMAIPLFQSIQYSFQDLRITSGKMLATQVGFTHYRFAFTVDVEFMPILQKTIVDMLFHVPLILVFSMFCAILLNLPMKGRLFFRGIFFMPVIIATGMVLKRLMDQGATELPIFQQVDMQEILNNFLPDPVIPPLLKMFDSLMLIMWGSGVQILIFLAALQTVPPSLYEAAKCDGATPWESFWKVTFPTIMPMVLVCTLFSIVDSFTAGNNQMMFYLHSQVFQKFNYGYASALGWIYFIFVFLVIAFVLYLFRRTSAMSHERR